MANLISASFLTLWVASLVFIPGTECEVTSAVGDRNGRILAQGYPRTAIDRGEGSSCAPATESAQGSSTTTEAAATDVYPVVATRKALALASWSKETASGQGEPGTGGDGSDIGFSGENAGDYCTRCPEEYECGKCCCSDGACVDGNDAETTDGTCSETGIESSLECTYCELAECYIFWWCR